jgi:dTDP-4-dehydrorhamnose reductase
MKVLIVGSKGMLGSDLMAEFRSGNDLLGMDLPEIDITQLDCCHRIIDKFQPDIVINASGYTRVDDCESHEKEAYAVNGQGPGNLATAAAHAGALLVHYGTDYIFDGRKSDPYLEEDAPNPQSAYGRSKLMGEELIRQNCPKHLILRTSWLFGANGPNFIKTIVSAAKQNPSLRVVHDQKGSPTYSQDLAAHTQQIIKAGGRGVYHVTNSGACTWFELACKAVEWARIDNIKIEPVTTAEYPRPARRPQNSILANAHLQRDGLAPMRNWQSAAREYVEHYLRS